MERQIFPKQTNNTFFILQIKFKKIEIQKKQRVLLYLKIINHNLDKQPYTQTIMINKIQSNLFFITKLFLLSLVLFGGAYLISKKNEKKESTIVSIFSFNK